MFSRKPDLDESTLFACLNQDSTKAQFRAYVEQLYGEFLKQICDRLTTLETPAQDREKVMQDLRQELEKLLELSKLHADTTARSRDKMTGELHELLQDMEKHQKLCNEGIKHRSQVLDAQEKAMAERISLLTARENTLADQEAQAAAGFHVRRDQILEDLKKLQEDFTTLNQELRKQETSCKTCITELTEERGKYYTELSTRILEESSRRLKELESQIDQIRDARLTEIDDEIQQKIAQANKKLKVAKRQEAENEVIRQGLEEKASGLEQEIQNRVKARANMLQTENTELRKQVEQQIPALVQELNQERHRLDQLIGDIVLKEGQELSPTEVALQYSAMKTELAKTRERLGEMPSAGEIEVLRQTRKEYAKLQQQIEKDNARVLNVAGTEHALQLAQAETAALRDEVEKLKDSNAAINDHYRRLQQTLKRYQEDDITRKQNRELCLQRLENQQDFPVTRAEAKGEEDDEIAWLEKISKHIQQSGFIFSKRILYAFHTALKTNEMSPLTVLAGVSGTGKSELPRLYAEFGGLNYYMVPVQPNWDSQESLLGYYNSLDNRFESQPLLHFLIENKLGPEQGGINDQMSIVLLDEMNLAHVELYFAEFLSKLEQRRGMEEGNFPELTISISADQKYHIPMSDNVLWVGTMNQDETTKALSDKVIDRSTSIFFPRPGKLVARKRFGHGKPTENRLSRELWNSWLMDIGHLYKPFEKMLDTYQNEVIEPINEALGMVGRGIGHRVWQSILYYMANYPTVALYLEMYHSHQLDNAKDAEARREEALQELDHAFQDQLVQKIMPKLRGIECRGTGKKCLDTIAGIIGKKAGALHNDFRKAMEFGQGQFLWLSADYLNQSETN